MLSGPFRRMPKGVLFFLLVLFVALEAAGGFGLYTNNKPVVAAVTPVVKPTPQPTQPAPYLGPKVLSVENTPRTVILGSYETFVVRMKGLVHAPLIFTIAYPDHTSAAFRLTTDSHGYSKHSFRIDYKPRQGVRDAIGFSVSYANQLEVTTRFAVQLPAGQTQ